MRRRFNGDVESLPLGIFREIDQYVRSQVFFFLALTRPIGRIR